MTALDRLRRRLGSPDGTAPRAFFDLETVKALLELADACEAEETAECGETSDGYRCPVDGHHETCPVAVARAARLSAFSTLRDLP